MTTDLVVQTTAKKYMEGATDETIRQRIMLAFLEREGRIEKNATGYDQTWTVRFANPPTTGYVEGQPHGFSQFNPFKQLNIDVRGNKGTDTLDLKQIVTNKGPQQIVDLWSDKIPALVDSMAIQLGKQMFADGSASGHETDFCGLNTFLNKTGGTCTAADTIKVPSGTYGGLTMDLQTYGGTWSTGLAAADRPNATLANDWPDGNGSPEYDFLAPKNVNYTSTKWTGVASWIANCDLVLRASSSWIRSTGGEGAAPNIFLMTPKMLRDFKTSMWSKYRIIQGSNQQALELGFPNAIDFEGSVLQEDFDVPAGVAYGINPNMMEMFIMGAPPSDFMAQRGGLFWSIGPRLVPGTTFYEFVIVIFGNCKFRPKHFAYLSAIA